MQVAARAFRDDIAKRGYRGYDLASDLTAQRPRPAPDSLLGSLPNLLGLLPPGTWPKYDVIWLDQILLGYLAIAGSQLSGIADLYAADDSLRLHPLTTLVRGVAEASGKIWWQCAPWLDTLGPGTYVTENERRDYCRRVLARSELARLDALADRRRRLAAAHGEISPQCQQAQVDIASYKAKLQALHGKDPGFGLTKGRKNWRVGGERLPDATTDLVIAVTEYAYGPSFMGSGFNIYPLYSGYAHASIELLFDKAPLTSMPPIPDLLEADEVEARRLAGIALRTFSVAYEITAGVRGSDLAALRDWEAEFTPMIVEPTP